MYLAETNLTWKAWWDAGAHTEDGRKGHPAHSFRLCRGVLENSRGRPEGLQGVLIVLEHRERTRRIGTAPCCRSCRSSAGVTYASWMPPCTAERLLTSHGPAVKASTLNPEPQNQKTRQS